MPRIPDSWFDAVIFLFPTREDAEHLRPVGGTAFIVSVGAVELAGRKIGFKYVVTNAHLTSGTTFARVNTVDGETTIIEIPRERWTKHPDGDDLAVAPIDRTADLSVTSVPLDLLLTEDDVEKWEIGPGDECFFLGRFGGLEGHQENRPTARFGNISAMKTHFVRQEGRGISQESVLVEARSLSGYSGSPVFAYSSSRFETSDDGGLALQPLIESRLFLLGVDWGHKYNRELVRDDDGPVDSLYVRSNSGLMMVVPAWKLRELLTSDEISAQREATLSEWAKRLDNQSDESAS